MIMCLSLKIVAIVLSVYSISFLLCGVAITFERQERLVPFYIKIREHGHKPVTIEYILLFKLIDKPA